MANNALTLSVQTVTDSIKKTILVVDDDPDSRQIFRDMLSDLGYDVVDKPDGASALLTIGDNGMFDLIITDYQMPHMNGLEFVERVRQFLPLVSIIMITAYGSIETYFRSRCLRVFEYINKPVKKRELDMIVKAALKNANSDHDI